ncbi:trafficking protein particle complex subunit 2-like protein [Cimex lectularius]|uniref:Trafficking protein particle complex subunit 2-like protein n=1 Tax=Cimex lectularius TaxID=79782 RepID=A0A8I6RE52_CIMLE|nr:trafficking protein particle complex subunit 2-like protein [Cimex lectularius]
MAVCIAVIGKENAPKYVACYEPEEELDFHYKVHMSLDIIQEKLQPEKRVEDLYLGLLYSTEEHRLYGYVTNTKIKFVVVFKSTSLPRENEIKAMMKNIHSAYIDVICNPFYIPGEMIKSKKFDKSAKSMLTRSSTKEN